MGQLVLCHIGGLAFVTGALHCMILSPQRRTSAISMVSRKLNVLSSCHIAVSLLFYSTILSYSVPPAPSPNQWTTEVSPNRQVAGSNPFLLLIYSPRKFPSSFTPNQSAKRKTSLWRSPENQLPSTLPQNNWQRPSCPTLHWITIHPLEALHFMALLMTRGFICHRWHIDERL